MVKSVHNVERGGGALRVGVVQHAPFRGACGRDRLDKAKEKLSGKVSNSQQIHSPQNPKDGCSLVGTTS